jgi:hypothetical protein
MKLYCGIDLHANNSVISIQDEQDKVHYESNQSFSSVIAFTLII